jgi:hypothetical protein
MINNRRVFVNNAKEQNSLTKKMVFTHDEKWSKDTKDSIA